MTAPTGSYGKAKDALADTLAGTSAFQTWVGAGDAETAAASIYRDALPLPANKTHHTASELADLRPFALVGTTRQGDRRYAPLEVRVRGNYSEILNRKMIPDHPDAVSWAVDRVEFMAETD